jgi:phosphate transport system permease protein
MTEHHSDRLEYFIAASATEPGDGSLQRPWRSFDEALAAIAGAEGEPIDVTSLHREYEFAFLSRAGETFQPPTKAQHQFYVNLDQQTGDGDGSELTPWSGLSAAVDGLKSQSDGGQLKPRAGECVRLSHRQIFSSTSVEQKKGRRETIARYTFLGMAMMLVLPVVAILGYLLMEAWPSMNTTFFFENPQNRMTEGGIWAPLIGTFFLVLISLVIAAPIGILAGVYLNEYAGDNWFTRIVHLAVVNLAGVPSIVHGLFGVGAFVYFANMNRSLLAASCTVAVMTLPVIITSTKEALAAVPVSFREACWNLGASRWQTIRTIVLPNSFTGILTGVILQVSRAAGETAPILFTGAVFFVPIADKGVESLIPYGLTDRFMALSYHLWTVSTQVQNVPRSVQFGTAVVLIGLVLVVNSLSICARLYLRSRKKW